MGQKHEAKTSKFTQGSKNKTCEQYLIACIPLLLLNMEAWGTNDILFVIADLITVKLDVRLF